MQTRLTTNEPIPGYHVRECLGTGGCGEVWKVDAPGGLTKAIKFVYGFHSDKRAAIELKALERVKEVRHPFLLSLERIEIVSGQLLIVTELADGSLRERFNECRRQGLSGVPRPELLRYLRDAADALDFMSEQHSLQHLDVKPENLLLLSKRIKVADFGLVKNFRHVTASLMGGLTPLYAAPEVFHGSPSKCSDQYSLAVVYQELLTGVLPFQADSPAKLTLQHLNELPDLSGLPESDRPVIARALAKDPSKRYFNCGELVEALVAASGGIAHVPGAYAARSSASVLVSESSPAVYKTVVCDRNTPVLSAVLDGGVSLELPPLPASAVRKLTPADLDSEHRAAGPALILGIGGSAGYVLRHFRRRICERYGSMAALPAISMLLLDTSGPSLAAASRGDDSASLGPNEILELPLRRPQDYRNNSDKFLRWLSRRWLYNIPRSLKTEGLRPLGRLAFVDHSKEVFARLRQIIAAAADPTAIAMSQQHAELRFQPGSLRIYVVASSSGATGSGMAIDLAYAVQDIRDQMKLADAGSLGIMMHFTTANPRHREVEVINTFSWLSEYDHFCRPNGRYPGDGSCGLPPRDPNLRPFTHTYLTHIGDGLGEEDLIQRVAAVADYLYLDLMTPAGRYLEACRKAECAESPLVARQAPIRTFGLSRATVMQHDLIDDAVMAIAGDTVADWLGHAEKSDGAGRPGPANPPRIGVSAFDRAGDRLRAVSEAIQLDAIRLEAQKLVTELVGKEPREIVQGLTASDGAATWSDVIRMADAQLGIADNPRDYFELPGTVLARPVRSIIRPVADRLAEQIRQAVLRLIDEPNHRLPGAKQALQRLRDRVQSIELESQRALAADRDRRIGFLESSKLNQEAAAIRVGSKTIEPLVQYFQRAQEEAVGHLAASLMRALSAELSTVLEQLIQLGRELEHLAATLSKPSDGSSLLPGDSSVNIRPLVADCWRKRRSELVAQVHQRIRNEFFEPAGGLHKVLAGGRAPELSSRLQVAARQTVLDAIQSIDLIGFLLADSAGGGSESGRLRSTINAATPEFLSAGGAKHLIAVLPSNASNQTNALQRLFEPDSSVLAASDNEFAVCCEGTALSLAHIAVDLIQRRRDYLELAARVHTRHDVDWLPLAGLAPVLATSHAIYSPSNRHAPAPVLSPDANPTNNPETSPSVL